MATRRTICKLIASLLFISLPRCVQGQTEVELISNIIVDLGHYFKSGCAYFIVTGDVRSHIRMILNTQKRLSDDFIRSAMLKSGNLVTHNNSLEGCVTPLYACIEGVDPRTLAKVEGLAGKVWIMFLKDISNLEKYFLNVNIPFDCEFIVASPLSLNRSFRLVEVYRVTEHYPLEEYELGTWSTTGGLELSSKSFYERRNKMNGVVFRTIVHKWAPLAYIKKVGYEDRIDMSGFFANVWNILENEMLFNSVFTVPDDGEWGTRLENGTWNGLMGTLLGNQSDMSAVGLAMTSQRVDYVDFTVPLFMNYLHIHIRQPRPKKTATLKNLTTPFSVELWLTLLVTFIALSAILILLLDRQQTVAVDVVLQVFGAIFCQQAMLISQEANSKRIVMFLVYLMGIIITTSYSCFVISSLTTYRPLMPFDSFNGFLDDGTYSLGMINNGYLHKEFKDAQENNHTHMQRAYEKHVATDWRNTPSTDEEGFQRVCESRYAYICEEGTLLMSTDLNCDVASLKHHFAKTFISLVFPKNSPYVGIFNHKLLKLMHSGILKKLYKDSYRKVAVVKPNMVYANFESVIPVIAIGIAGVVISVLVLVCEILHSYVSMR